MACSYLPFEGIGVEENAEKLEEKAERKETLITLLDAYISAQTEAGRSLIIVGDFVSLGLSLRPSSRAPCSTCS